MWPPTHLGLGCNMANDEAMRTSREATVNYEGYGISKPSTHDGGGMREHVGHTRPTLGSLVTNNHHHPKLNLFSGGETFITFSSLSYTFATP